MDLRILLPSLQLQKAGPLLLTAFPFLLRAVTLAPTRPPLNRSAEMFTKPLDSNVTRLLGGSSTANRRGHKLIFPSSRLFTSASNPRNPQFGFLSSYKQRIGSISTSARPCVSNLQPGCSSGLKQIVLLTSPFRTTSCDARESSVL
jgi:hypothetical protein